MPRGAAVVYPKDAGQIVAMADIFPGARVVEAGVGSGALSMSLLRAVGDHGMLHSFERREDFADIAQGNVGRSSAASTPPGGSRSATSVESCRTRSRPAASTGSSWTCSRPWECLDAVGDALAPGGVLICYVATATQLSRVAEATRDHGGFTEPQAWESLVRGWHLEGLAVRPAAPHGRPHRLPRHDPPAGRRRDPAAAQAPSGQGHVRRRRGRTAPSRPAASGQPRTWASGRCRTRRSAAYAVVTDSSLQDVPTSG